MGGAQPDQKLDQQQLSNATLHYQLVHTSSSGGSRKPSSVCSVSTITSQHQQQQLLSLADALGILGGADGVTW